jgi:hypothetical protein
MLLQPSRVGREQRRTRRRVRLDAGRAETEPFCGRDGSPCANPVASTIAVHTGQPYACRGAHRRRRREADGRIATEAAPAMNSPVSPPGGMATSRSSDASISSTRPYDLDAGARFGRIYTSRTRLRAWSRLTGWRFESSSAHEKALHRRPCSVSSYVKRYRLARRRDVPQPPDLRTRTANRQRPSSLRRTGTNERNDLARLIGHSARIHGHLNGRAPALPSASGRRRRTRHRCAA